MNLPTSNSTDAPPGELVGRSREFDSAVSAVWAGKSVLLVGPWGSGLSRFTWSVLERLVAQGGEVIALLARNTAFLGRDQPVRVVRTLGDLRQAVEGVKHLRPPIVVLDAAGSLDDEACRWLSENVKAGRVTAMAMIRSEGGPLRRDLAAICDLVGLWLEGYAIRVDLGPLPREAAAEVITSASAGRALNGESRAMVMRDSGSLPVLLKELTRIMVDLADAPLRVSALFPPNPAPVSRALDLVEPRLRDLSVELQRALVSVAVLDGISESRLRRRVPVELVTELLTRDLAQVDTFVKRVTVRRIEAERVLALGIDADRQRLVAGILDDLQAGFVLDAAESLFAAGEVLNNPPLRRDVAADLLGPMFVTAARECLARGRLERSFDFAIAAQKVDAHGAQHEVDRARAALLGKDGDAFLSAEFAELIGAMQWVQVKERASSILEHSDDQLEKVNAYGPLALANAALGDADALRDTLVQFAALGPHLMRVAPPHEIASTNEALVHFTIHGSVALVLAGMGWDKLDDGLDYMTEWTLSHGFAAQLPLLAGPRGMLAFGRGDFALAAAEFERATESDYASASPLSRPWLLAMWSRSAVRLGDDALAALLIGRIEAERRARSPWEEYALLQARADLLAIRGNVEGATELLVAEALREATMSPVFTVVMVYEAIRNGARDDRLLELLTEATSQVSLDAIRGMADIARDWVARDSRALSRDRWTAEQRGLTLLAQQIVEAGGDARSAGRGAGDSRESLSEREREVARLAGTGLSNSEIAAKLYLSVRTVESHLYSARLKTGASTRRDLGRIAGADVAPR
ncbi:LuxR C-terminal-related transcriptional regulator [Herbiconiux sp. L3-i23]|uniref:helix-turn-helix transcriptional regulator n=1 Tax=Herbiconiux sp. L3-i23 TaxID=2905871 RepID=UPI00207434E6|nr:LuxR C-terminal-related transcriptional regulator [Herbiconiux sp. L3-i23]